MKSTQLPRVSVGVPVYNGERYLAQTLDSLLSQTFDDFEIIVCDNASTDLTETICRTYAAQDARIRYVRNVVNLGASENYRRVLELSSGEYFRWANSDDLSSPEALARCVKILDQEPAVVLSYPKTTLIDDHGNFISEYEDGLNLQSPHAYERFAQAFTNVGLVHVIYGLMRSKALRQTKLLRNFPGGDIPLVLELALYGRFWEIPERLFYCRIHGTSSSSYGHDVTRTQEFFDPKTKGHIFLRSWRHLMAHCGSVLRAPIGIVGKCRLVLYLARTAVWTRGILMRELADTVNILIRKIVSIAGKFFSAASH